MGGFRQLNRCISTVCLVVVCLAWLVMPWGREAAAEEGSPPGAAETAAEVALTEPEAQTGLFEVSWNEAPESLLVDGVAVELGEERYFERLNPGAHTLRATKRGFRPYEASFDVVAGGVVRVKIVFEPEGGLGRLVVRERSGGDLQVFIDGSDVGKAPWRGELPEGAHRVEGRGERLTAAPQVVEVVRGGDHEVVLEGKPKPGKLIVRVGTPGATLLLDGRPVELPFSTELPAGTYEIQVKAPGYQTVVRQVDVPPGEEHTEGLHLVRDLVPPRHAPEPVDRTIQPGVLLGVLTAPRPLQGELALRLGTRVTFGIQLGMLPEITLSTGDDSELRVATRAWQGLARWFPFEGAFFVGLGMGMQRLTASAENSFAVSSIVAENPFVTPRVGWLWITDVGFTIGFGVGMQFALGSTSEVTTQDKLGVPIPPAADEERQRLADDVAMVARYGARLPLPVVELLQVGWFF